MKPIKISEEVQAQLVGFAQVVVCDITETGIVVARKDRLLDIALDGDKPSLGTVLKVDGSTLVEAKPAPAAAPARGKHNPGPEMSALINGYNPIGSAQTF